jgi:hypothetical protein
MDTNDVDGVRRRVVIRRDDIDRVRERESSTDDESLRVSFTISNSDAEELKDICKKLRMPMTHVLRALVKCGTFYYKDNLEKRWIGWDEEAQEPIEREDWQKNYWKFRKYGSIR